MAGLTVIPSIVKDFSDEQSLELALIENLQREDLNAMDEAEGYALLAKEFSMTQEQIAKKVGKDRSTVANMLRLLTLPEKITHSLRKEEITVGHARALLAITEAEKQLEVYRQILKNNLNVRDVELLATGGQEKIQVARKGGLARPAGGRRRLFTQNAELNALVERLTTHLGTKVKVFGTQERGKLEVHYYSKDDLERVVNLLTAASTPSPSLAERSSAV
jgi:ParB family chromosome partitioning protein